MAATLLLHDPDEPTLRPLTRLRSRFALRNGVYTTAERVRAQNPDVKLVFRHPDQAYESLISGSENMTAWSDLPPGQQSEVSPLDDIAGGPAAWLARLDESIATDIEILLRSRSAEFQQAGSPRVTDRFRDISVHIVGPREHLYLHRDCIVLPGTVFDLRSGPILVDQHVQVSPFSFLEGPLYVGSHARLDNVRITGGSVIGHYARVGGEIENSIVNDFSNKHHEGFLGHSILAPWVNLGALATTSDLKNNYGRVRLVVPGRDLPDIRETTSVDTGTIKFGALIGECAKVAIGTMLSTGTVIDVGANVFGGSPGAYVPPFRWGQSETYSFERFIADARRIFARREQVPPANFETLARRAHPGDTTSHGT